MLSSLLTTISHECLNILHERKFTTDGAPRTFIGISLVDIKSLFYAAARDCTLTNTGVKTSHIH